MPPRSFYLAALSCLGIALILGIITSISLPFFSAIDFVRVNATPNSNIIYAQIRFGLWSPCTYGEDGARSCLFAGHGYSLLIPSLTLQKSVVIGSSWTRGLAIHPVATGLTGIALGFACSTLERGPIIATLTSFLAAFCTFIAFIVDIALYAYVKGQIAKLDNSNRVSTVTSSAFWLTFVTLILLIASTLTIFIGQRREVSGGAYPAFSSSGKGGFLARFRKS